MKNLVKILDEMLLELETAVLNDRIFSWIRAECRDQYQQLQRERIESRKNDLKKNWLKISREEFRARRKAIDEMAEELK